VPGSAASVRSARGHFPRPRPAHVARRGSRRRGRAPLLMRLMTNHQQDLGYTPLHSHLDVNGGKGFLIGVAVGSAVALSIEVGKWLQRERKPPGSSS
jgi:hypothetical protein